MLKLVTYDAPIPTTISKLGVGDVVATKIADGGVPQRLRAVHDKVVNRDGTVTLTLALPRSGKSHESFTQKEAYGFLWVGNVEAYPTASKTPTKVKVQDTSKAKPSEKATQTAFAPKGQDRMAAARAAKAAKRQARLDSEAGQVTPKAEPKAPKATVTEPKAQPSGSLTDRIAAKLQPAIERLLDAAIDQAIENALR
jgi:hypothetical protein